MRQPFNTSTIPFTNNEIPGIIYGPDYDMGKLNYAYKDVDYENTSGEDWNNGWTYRNDGVDIEACSDISSNGYDVGWIENGEWLTYTANVSQSGLYDIYINIAAANSGGALILSLDGQYITSAISVPVTGGWQNWQSLIVNDVYISAGTHVVKIMFFFGGFNFSSMEFLLTATDVEQDEQNPLSFDLTQNYPNPFNPTTQIEFSIPSTKGNNTDNVVLKVFDALGNEIETLLNEPKAAGNYKIDFVGSKLSSGVYFYKLQYGDYQSIKKMILMK